jgi:large subunit ribosomal protein L10
LDRTQKEAVVERLREDLEPGGHLILAEYRGLTVEQISEFRKKVRSVSGKVRVMKNTLVRHAVDGTEKDVLTDLLTGPNALVFTKEDPVPLVKIVAEASKNFEAVKVKGGVIEGRAVSPEEIFRIATLPSREELLGKALGSISAPLQGFMNVCQGVTRNLVYVLESIRQAKEVGA